uniref:Haemalin n=1 Tax=Haemaphysalis qinghaiensis TaxID=297592 RepID=A0AA96PWZ5_9ACAR|nr:haemalin [Haemaphysalis qinghaiensis]
MKLFVFLALFGAAVAQRNAVCRLPAKPGICRAYIPRYYFDVEKGQCSVFIYGGCQGNENNFETLKECEDVCAEPKRPQDFEKADFETGCKPAPESGLCKASMERWFFNAESGECEVFIYGGCGGNDNNYENQEECEFACK